MLPTPLYTHKNHDFISCQCDIFFFLCRKVLQEDILCTTLSTCIVNSLSQASSPGSYQLFNVACGKVRGGPLMQLVGVLWLFNSVTTIIPFITYFRDHWYLSYVPFPFTPLEVYSPLLTPINPISWEPFPWPLLISFVQSKILSKMPNKIRIQHDWP